MWRRLASPHDNITIELSRQGDTSKRVGVNRTSKKVLEAENPCLQARHGEIRYYAEVPVVAQIESLYDQKGQRKRARGCRRVHCLPGGRARRQSPDGSVTGREAL